MHPPSPRSAGILLPVFSVRRDGDLGVGDVRGLREWLEWAAEHGVSFIQVLPINECGVDPSPYGAISSVALDPLYLSLEPRDLPWLEQGEFDRARARLAEKDGGERVNHALVRRLKRTLLELAWQNYLAEGECAELEAFREAESDWLDDYCVFRFLMDEFGEQKEWDEWPASARTPKGACAHLAKLRAADAAMVEHRLGYFAFVQMVCFKQWRELRAHALRLGVKLMGDVPFGVNRHSCDVFFGRDAFHLQWSGGSPAERGSADPFVSQWGQNWGIPLYRWDVMEADGFSWWRERLARMREFFDIVRLDHVLGFYRIYAFPWRSADNHRFIGLSHEEASALAGGRLPQWSLRGDDTVENEAANRRDGDVRLRGILTGLEDMQVVAEDLGWVPEYVRPHLADLGVACFRIPHWDCNEWGHPTPGNCFPENTFATYSTHDHDPLNMIWNGCVDMIQHPGDAQEWQVEGAKTGLRMLGQFAGIPWPSDGHPRRYTKGVKLRLMKALLDANSRDVCFAVQEIFSVPGRINHAGSNRADNWTWRIPWTVAQLREHDGLAEASRHFANLILLSGRRFSARSSVPR